MDRPLPTKQNSQCSKNVTDRQPLKASLCFNLLWEVDELHVKFLNDIPQTWTYRGGGLNFEVIFNWASLWNMRGTNIPRLKEVEVTKPAHIRVKFTGECMTLKILYCQKYSDFESTWV